MCAHSSVGLERYASDVKVVGSSPSGHTKIAIFTPKCVKKVCQGQKMPVRRRTSPL